MRLEALRSRLAPLAGAPPPPILDGDEGHALRHPAGGRVPAAVLVGLVARPEGPRILLTQRTAHLKDHAGQISLPGGRIETGDPDPVAAALREAEEEIGLAPARVEILGGLPVYDTITGFRIHPVVGWIEPPIELRPDPYEVAELFELPLGFALDPRNHERDSYERDGRRRHFFVLRYDGRYIWGATAGILVNLSRLLAG
jgi:8-oxo-dGTP pyrophosphatase MutT (NUDIX family)